MRLRAIAIAGLFLVSAGLAAPAAQGAQGAKGAQGSASTTSTANSPSTASRSAASWAVRWGRNGDLPVPGDYGGDRRTDIAVVRGLFNEPFFPPSPHLVWYIRGVGTVVWGRGDGFDWPVPADYNGDGKTDIAVVRTTSETAPLVWYIRGVGTFTWGRGTDGPVPGDYNGDGRADLAVVHVNTATGTLTWHIRGVGTVAWGRWGMDSPAPADYNGDKRTDIAVVRSPKTEHQTPLTWYIRGASPVTWGRSFSATADGSLWEDHPVPANYIRGRHDDIAVWRESTGQWFIRGFGRTVTWGGPYDTPVPGDYGGDKRTDIAVVRLAITEGVDPSRLPLIWYIRAL